MCSAEDDFLSVISGTAIEEFFVIVEEDGLRLQECEFIDELMDDFSDTILARVFDPDISKLGIGRIGKHLALGERMREKIFIISALDDLEKRGIRGECLDDERNLLAEIIGNLIIYTFLHVIFWSREIRLEKAKNDESEIFWSKCVPKLGCYDDSSSLEIFLGDRLMTLLIRIKPEYIRIWKKLSDRLFDFLDTDTDGSQVRAMTLAADPGNWLFRITLMAQKMGFWISVECERDVTEFASDDISAIFTKKRRSFPATIQVEEHLFFFG